MTHQYGQELVQQFCVDRFKGIKAMMLAGLVVPSDLHQEFVFLEYLRQTKSIVEAVEGSEKGAWSSLCMCVDADLYQKISNRYIHHVVEWAYDKRKAFVESADRIRDTSWLS